MTVRPRFCKERVAAAGLAVATALALWIFTRTSAAFLMVVVAGNHIAGYAESSNGCLMFGGMIDAQAMNGVQNAFAVGAPLDWRGPWFGQPFAGNLRAFTFAFQRETSGFTLGLSIPYWFIIREPIFKDDLDRRRFLETLGEVCAKTLWQVHAYCLMNNHFHLVLETPPANLVAARLVTRRSAAGGDGHPEGQRGGATAV